MMRAIGYPIDLLGYPINKKKIEKNLTFLSKFGIIVVKGEERFSPI